LSFLAVVLDPLVWDSSQMDIYRSLSSSVLRADAGGLAMAIVRYTRADKSY